MKKVIFTLLATTILLASCYNSSAPEPGTSVPVVGKKIKSEHNKQYITHIDESYIIRDLTPFGKYYSNTYSKALQYITPNDKAITIFAQNKVTDDMMLKAYNMIAFYLESDGNIYKKADKVKIANKMGDNWAILSMGNGKDKGNTNMTGQPLYEMETVVPGSKWYLDNDYEHRDASYEEILHMVHDQGIGTKGKAGAMPTLQKRIWEATMNALPKNESDWGNKGLWGWGSRKWLFELKEQNSLEQEYLAAANDSFWGL